MKNNQKEEKRMVYTQKDIKRLLKNRNEESIKTLSLIAGEDGEFPYEVEDKIKKVVELLADLYCSYITEKECCRSIEDNRKRYVWHAMARQIADRDLDE